MSDLIPLQPDNLAVITGAASGIGLATAQLLWSRGIKILGIDRHPTPDADRYPYWAKADFAELAQVEGICGRLSGLAIDHLVLCAGIAGVGKAETVLRINFLAARQLLDRLAPAVRYGGAITVISSGAGWRWLERKDALIDIIDEPDDERALAKALALSPEPGEAYNCSKELLCAMVARRCLDHWPRGVRLNSVSPGGVATPLIPVFTASMGQDAMSFSVATVGRHGEPMEIAEVIAFLGESRARWVNGADLRVDGGLVGALASGAAHFNSWV